MRVFPPSLDKEPSPLPSPGVPGEGVRTPAPICEVAPVARFTRASERAVLQTTVERNEALSAKAPSTSFSRCLKNHALRRA